MRHARSLARFISLVALAVAPFAVGAQGRAVNGTYNGSLNTPNGALRTVIVITGDKSALTGTLDVEGFPSMPLSKVTPSDSGLAVIVDTPDGVVTMALKFLDASKVKGTVLYQGMEMALEGTFTPVAPSGGASKPEERDAQMAWRGGAAPRTDGAASGVVSHKMGMHTVR
jgi:hypothetical protein